MRDIVSIGSIQNWLNNRSISNQKYILFIDGLDEIEYAAAKRIIEEEQYLAILSPENLILIGSRPLTYLPKDSYQIEIKALSEVQQEELINAIVSDENIRFLPSVTPDQLKQSLSRPLFCIIYALLKNDENLGWATNEIDLLSIFVEKATKEISENFRAVYDDLVVLSVKAVDKDFSDIHISEISLSETIDTILKTGLVNKQGDYLNFPLVIIAQFLAAKALQQKIVDISSIIASKEKLARWKYPLSILFESYYASDCGKGFTYRDKEYNTVSAVFDALSYEEIRYNCGVWTGIETGAITYEMLVEYAAEFAIAIPAAADYTALLEDDADAANDMYQDACQKVLRAVTDGLIDTWHSSCIIRSKRSKAQK